MDLLIISFINVVRNLNYAVLNLKCSICGVVGSAIANIEWGGIMVDFEWSDEVDIEGYLPTFELQRKEL